MCVCVCVCVCVLYKENRKKCIQMDDKKLFLNISLGPPTRFYEII